MKITPEMFGLTKEEVAQFEKQDERLAKLREKLSTPEHCCDRSGWMPGDGCPACEAKK